MDDPASKIENGYRDDTRVYDFKIEGSVDSKTWFKLYQNKARGWVTAKFPDQKMKYLRFIGNGHKYWWKSYYSQHFQIVLAKAYYEK